jgi:hypothetical protein
MLDACGVAALHLHAHGTGKEGRMSELWEVGTEDGGKAGSPERSLQVWAGGVWLGLVPNLER